MDPVVLVVGAVAEAGAWFLVTRRRRNIWTTITPVLAALGAAAVLAGSVELSPRVAAGAAAAAGMGAGVVLYLATRAFVFVVRGWTGFRQHSIRLYLRQGGLPFGAALLLSVGVSAVGEELFWRGLFQPALVRGVDDRALGSLLAYLAYVAVNLPSANFAVVAGALVGGAVWAALGFWTGGMLSSLCCHAVWTGLMLGFPVVRRADLGTRP